MAMFDPAYVTKVLNDILSRRGLSVSLVPKDSQGFPIDGQRDNDQTTQPGYKENSWASA